MERRILVIDDNPGIHRDFQRLLSQRAATGLDELEAALFGDGPSRPVRPTYTVDAAHQGEEGFQKVRAAITEGRPYMLAFVDMNMPPGWDGIRTIDAIFGVDPEVQVVVCTAYAEVSWEEFNARFPACDRILILKKPFDTAEVWQLASALTEKWHLARHAHLKRVQLEAMVQEQTAELRRTNAELRASQARFALAAAGARDGVWDWDLVTGRVFYSPRFRSLIGVDDEADDSPELWFASVLPAHRPLLEAAFSAHFAGETDHVELEYRATLSGGRTRWLLCRGVATRDGDGRAIRAAGSLTDITDRKLAEEQLRRLAFHDALTGLPNRALLRDRLERCVARAKREPGWRYAVFYFDLDRFKLVNDRLGHAAGDQLLRQVADRITGSVRELDTLSRQLPDPLARLAGDEFVLLLEGLRDDADALRVARRVLELLDQPFHLDGGAVSVGSSIGIVFGHGGYASVDEVLRDADLALYHAKHGGRGRFEVFDAPVHAAIQARWELEADLRAAIGTGALRMHYQPIVSLATGRIESIEALVRWEHPRRGTILPADFVPLAEETGLIVPLGLEVLALACRDLRALHLADPQLADLRLAVNISGRQLADGRFAADFAEIVDHAGLDPASIDVEITESVLMEHDPVRLLEVEALRRLGAHIHLDDFGTGYCSLSYLRHVRVDALKIDRSFVTLIESDPMTEHIVRAILALAHSLGTKVIAEGVETAQQRARMTRLGCDQAQGFLFLPPVPADALFERLIGYAPEMAARSSA